MSSATANSYPESVGSCRPPSPPTPSALPPPPAPSAPRGAPVRRQLDFTGGGGGGDLEDEDDFLCRVADDIERAYSEAKRRAPPCVCGRGQCAVEQDGRGGWMYVCSARPKCKHVALCENVDHDTKEQLAARSDPETSNPCLFNTPSNHVADARTPINNVDLGGAVAATPTNIIPHGVTATTPFNRTSQGASPLGAGVTAVFKASPRGARSINEKPICQCTAGKCIKVKVGEDQYYVCPIPKGKGACSYKVPVKDVAKEPSQTRYNNASADNYLKDGPVEKEAHGKNLLVEVGDINANASVNPAQADDEWLFDIIDDDIVPTAQATPLDKIRQESPSMQRQPVTMVMTPTKSPVPPCGTRSPMTPLSNKSCFRCGEEGHWIRDCPKLSPGSNTCYQCGEAGHWRPNCPQLRGS